jgi:hypothetical protein
MLTSRLRPPALWLFGFLLALVLVASVDAASASTRFVSKRYGYSIVLPGGSGRWVVDLATANWTSGVITPHFAAIDTFSDRRNGRLYLLAARRPPATVTLAKWTRFVLARFPAGCRADGSFSSSTLAGAPGRVFTASCTDGFKGIAIAALHAHRGYFLIVAAGKASSLASSRQAFSAARRAFRYTR